jgi:3-deoxy-7-phosphoheptulonate synthase
MASPELHARTPWHPARWRRFAAAQTPGWPQDAALFAVRNQLAARPPLVTPDEVSTLRRRLTQVTYGRAVVLQLGDCAETFRPPTAAGIASTVAMHRMVTGLVDERLRLPTVDIGRIAGQYAKPRSSPTEEVAGGLLPAFRGFLINGPTVDIADRRPEPRRMLWGYEHAARTIALLRRTARGGQPMRGHWGDDLPALWTSHEALVLDYEEPLTRWDTRLDAWTLTSTHLPWVGERTRHANGAHVWFLAGIGNPVGCKIGPTTTVDEITRLARILDPDRQLGRLVFISRMGADNVASILPELVRVVMANGHRPVWLCDPMHGNTVRASSGHKTRHVSRIVDEITGFVDAVRLAGGWPGGLHLEATADAVTECVGGGCGITEDQIPDAYLTACDPRLNPGQTLDVVSGFVNRLQESWLVRRPSDGS